MVCSISETDVVSQESFLFGVFSVDFNVAAFFNSNGIFP
jgi:hypothetical protein